jgi:hypothetical protein
MAKVIAVTFLLAFVLFLIATSDLTRRRIRTFRIRRAHRRQAERFRRGRVPAS